jgi:hypothetical protein
MKHAILQKRRLELAPALAILFLLLAPCPESRAFNPCRGETTTNYCGRPGMLYVTSHNNYQPRYTFTAGFPPQNASLQWNVPGVEDTGHEWAISVKNYSNDPDCPDTISYKKREAASPDWKWQVSSHWWTLLQGTNTIPATIWTNEPGSYICTFWFSAPTNRNRAQDNCWPTNRYNRTATLRLDYTTIVLRVDINMDVNYDGRIDNDDQPLKRDPGGILLFNDNDDNQNGIPDYLDDGPYRDNDLRPITIGIDAGYGGVDQGTLTLSAHFHPDRIRIWDSVMKTNPIPLPQTWPVTNYPSRLYVEGIQPSDYPRDIRMRLRYQNGNWDHSDILDLTIIKVDTIEASSPVADNSPQSFEGHKTDFGNPCDPSDPGQALVVFHKDVRDEDFVVQDYDVTLKANILPASITADQLSESWAKVAGPSSGSLNRTDTFEVKYQNAKEGGLYQFEFDLGFSGCAKSGANLLLPLGGPDVTDYLLSEAQRYEDWLITMKTRVQSVSDSDWVKAAIILGHTKRTVAAMLHREGTYEAGNSPCKQFCPGTITVEQYVFRKDFLGNFLFGYLSSKIKITLGSAKLAAWVIGEGGDDPDDYAAIDAGYQYGWTSSCFRQPESAPLRQSESAPPLGWLMTMI